MTVTDEDGGCQRASRLPSKAAGSSEPVATISMSSTLSAEAKEQKKNEGARTRTTWSSRSQSAAVIPNAVCRKKVTKERCVGPMNTARGVNA